MVEPIVRASPLNSSRRAGSRDLSPGIKLRRRHSRKESLDAWGCAAPLRTHARAGCKGAGGREPRRKASCEPSMQGARHCAFVWRRGAAGGVWSNSASGKIGEDESGIRGRGGAAGLTWAPWPGAPPRLRRPAPPRRRRYRNPGRSRRRICRRTPSGWWDPPSTRCSWRRSRACTCPRHRRTRGRQNRCRTWRRPPSSCGAQAVGGCNKAVGGGGKAPAGWQARRRGREPAAGRACPPDSRTPARATRPSPTSGLAPPQRSKHAAQTENERRGGKRATKATRGAGGSSHLAVLDGARHALAGGHVDAVGAAAHVVLAVLAGVGAL